MTEKEAIKLGFEFVKTYNHDDYRTNRFVNGVIELEFTYLQDKLVTADVTIEEINCMEVNREKLYMLNKLLNGKKKQMRVLGLRNTKSRYY